MAEINATQMRDALAWATNDPDKAKEPSTNPFVWFWEAVQGDFNENRSTSQIVIDAAISMIPLVDQVCDARDLIANCKKLREDMTDTWAWVALALTLIGLFPTLGSLVKGVLKIFFLFVRRMGGDATVKAVELAMTWVITFLRRRDVQKYLKNRKVDEVFNELAKQVKEVRGKVNLKELLAAFDRGIGVLDGLVNKVSLIPTIGKKAKAALEQVRDIRLKADAGLAKVVTKVQDILSTIAMRLEREALETRHGIVNANNVHFRGVLPEAAAVGLMRKQKPSWLSKKGDTFIDSADLNEYRKKVDNLSAKKDASGQIRSEAERFPTLTDDNIQSFHKLAADVIKGPTRLYRVLAPNSRAMSDCWVTKEVFDKLQSQANPKAAWRRYLAVWPDWNVDGQFVIYDVKAGETLNVWRGPASSQKKEALDGFHLEGGWEQIVFKLEKGDARADTIRYYKIKNGKTESLGKVLNEDEVAVLTKSMNERQKRTFYSEHLAVREKINHPNISGPFETGWGYEEFDGAGMFAKVGLPELPGQTTQIRK